MHIAAALAAASCAGIAAHEATQRVAETAGMPGMNDSIIRSTGAHAWGQGEVGLWWRVGSDVPQVTNTLPAAAFTATQHSCGIGHGAASLPRQGREARHVPGEAR